MTKEICYDLFHDLFDFRKGIVSLKSQILIEERSRMYGTNKFKRAARSANGITRLEQFSYTRFKAVEIFKYKIERVGTRILLLKIQNEKIQRFIILQLWISVWVSQYVSVGTLLLPLVSELITWRANFVLKITKQLADLPGALLPKVLTVSALTMLSPLTRTRVLSTAPSTNLPGQ